MTGVPDEAQTEFTHVLRWDRLRRKGQRCRIVKSDDVPRHLVRIRFEDNSEHFVDRQAIIPVKKHTSPKGPPHVP